MLDYLRTQLADLARKMRNLAARGVQKMVDDSRGRQTLQVELAGGELADGVERFQNFGLSSVPPQGSEAILLALNGDRSQLVALAVEDRPARPKSLAEGETQVYSAVKGRIYLMADNTLLLDNGQGVTTTMMPDGTLLLDNGQGVTIALTPAGNIELMGIGLWTGDVTITGNLTVTANLTVGGNVVIAGSLAAASANIGGIDFLTHRHSLSGGGTTGPVAT